MPHVSFILKDGTTTVIAADAGQSVMQVATTKGLPGIEAICGGFCSCATCHVYVDAAWLDRLPAMTEDEEEMLDGTAAERRPTSRLSCQIKLTPELDGLVVAVPERQA